MKLKASLVFSSWLASFHCVTDKFGLKWELFKLPTVYKNPCQEQGRHILRGFSINFFLAFRLKLKGNQFYFRTIRKLKIDELPAIWIPDQDEIQFSARFWMMPAVRKRWGSTFRFQAIRDVWSKIILCI